MLRIPRSGKPKKHWERERRSFGMVRCPRYARSMPTSRIPNLQRLRQERRLTQPQLAEALGINKRTILRWEAGEGEPGATELVAMARFFGVSIDQLVAELGSAGSSQPLAKVADLSSSELDYWVAKMQGMAADMTPDGPVLYEPGYGHRPVPKFSFDLSLASSIMQNVGMHLHAVPAGIRFDGAEKKLAGWIARSDGSPLACWGRTLPEAGMRAYLSGLVGTHVVAGI